mgnify:CR=1 FL=1
MRAFVIFGSTISSDDSRTEWIESVVWSQERAEAVVQQLTERDQRLMSRELRIQADLRSWEQANPRPPEYVAVIAEDPSADGKPGKRFRMETTDGAVIARFALNVDGLKEWSVRCKNEEARLRTDIHPQTEYSRCPDHRLAKGDFDYGYQETEAEEPPAVS